MLGTTVVNVSRTPAHASVRAMVEAPTSEDSALRAGLPASERKRQAGAAHRMICRERGHSAMPGSRELATAVDSHAAQASPDSRRSEDAPNREPGSRWWAPPVEVPGRPPARPRQTTL